LAVIGVAGGAVFGGLIGRPSSESDQTVAARPTDQPATQSAALQASPPIMTQAQAADAVASRRSAASASPPPTAPPIASLASAGPNLAAAHVVKTKATKPAHAKRRGKPAHAPAAEPAAPEKSWEEQRRDYEIARATYDASERQAGYRWAQQNNIRVQRYCGVAAQRTQAFVEGCLSYLHPRRVRGPAKSPDQAEASRDEG
jgi:hypothetical protein